MRATCLCRSLDVLPMMAGAAIGDGQTISKPYIVPFMSALLERREARLLEIGTASGIRRRSWPAGPLCFPLRLFRRWAPAKGAA